jgi:arylformamidase
MPGKNGWLDISVPLHSGMVHWPGDPEPNFERISDMEGGAEANVTFCRLSAHTGTHMDAPGHFLPGGSGIDSFPLEAGIGAARVIAMAPECRVIGRRELEGKGIEKGERLLFKTRNSSRRWDDAEFQRDYVALNASGAEFLVQAGITLVGVDYLSVGVFEGDGPQTHRVLLGGGIWIVEGLNLSEVSEGKYDLVCLPLRIAGSDGSPARVAIRSAVAD